MKFMALVLSVCILFLSTAGMVKPVEPVRQQSCCHKRTGTLAAAMKKMREQHQKSCDKQGCTMLFSCALCGFIVIEPLRFESHTTAYNMKPISLYSIGDLSTYYPSDWKPPKIC